MIFAQHPTLFQKLTTCGPVAYHKLLLDMPVKEFCRLAVEKKGYYF